MNASQKTFNIRISLAHFLKAIAPTVLRLNLPPELAGRMVIYISVFILALGGVGWMVFNYARAGSTPPTVKIGLVAPFEGEYRNTGYEVLFAVKLALNNRNQGEGLKGYRVELVALNDHNNPDEARRQARSLVADPDIMGVVGHLSPASTAAALPVYHQARMAVVSPWSVDAAVLDGNFYGVVSVAATTDAANAHLENVIREMDIKRVTPLATEDDTDNIPANSQAVQISADAVQAGNILSNLQAVGNKNPKFGQVETGNRQLLQTAGAAAEGLIFVSPGPSAAEVNDATFLESYQAMAGLPPGPRAILAYDATNVLLDSIEKTMNLNDTWYNYLLNRSDVRNVTFTIQTQGLSGDIAFNKYGQRLDAPVWVYQISNTRYPGTLLDP